MCFLHFRGKIVIFFFLIGPESVPPFTEYLRDRTIVLIGMSLMDYRAMTFRKYHKCIHRSSYSGVLGLQHRTSFHSLLREEGSKKTNFLFKNSGSIKKIFYVKFNNTNWKSDPRGIFVAPSFPNICYKRIKHFASNFTWYFQAFLPQECPIWASSKYC